MFEYKSKEFTSVSKMISEKRELTESICNHFDIDRNKFRLQQGSILLQGLYDGKWLNLTSVIGEFPTKN
jgi:hypothetical protein